MKTLALATLTCLVAVTFAAYGPYNGGHYHRGYYYQDYHGRYPGHCPQDGLYTHDDYSIHFCSGGVATVQHCAPGTKHSYGHTHRGYAFCDVNLNDLNELLHF